jgi:hypothetical protein
MSDDLIKRDDALNACVLREDNPPTEMQLSLRNVISALPAVDLSERIEQLEAKLAKAVEMGNPFAGEVTITLDGVPHLAKLTLGALAELEAALESGSLVDLISRFEAQHVTTRDVLALVVAGLRGGGWQGTAADLLQVEIGGGLLGATQNAAQLLDDAAATLAELE